MPGRRERDAEVPNLYRNGKTGIWYIRKFVSGREVERSLKTQNRHEAVRRLNQLLVNWPREKTTKITFREYATRVIEEVFAFKSQKYFESIEGACRLHLFSELGHYPLTEIGARWPFYVARQSQLTPDRKITHDRKAVIAILGLAKREGFIAKVPELELRQTDKNVKKGVELTDEEIERIFAHKRLNRKWRLKLRILLTTGMRRQEQRFMKWADVDFTTGRFEVSVEGDKTKRGRQGRLTQEILTELIEHRARQAKSEHGPSVYIFPNEYDPTKPESPSQSTWLRIRDDLGLTANLHLTRHTAATRVRRAGVPDVVARKVLGMSQRVMDRIYDHLRQSDYEDFSNNLNKSYGKSLGHSGSGRDRGDNA